MSELSGWGRYPVVDVPIKMGEDLHRITEDAVLSRGLGRAYGDAALPSGGAVAVTTLADRIRAFDPATGVLRAEAGLSLSQLMRDFLHRGYFTPVSTGTQYVTLGGAVASDVHGKNHHVHGTFSNFVRALSIRIADGTVLECTPDNEYSDLFWASCGGMGLTGHILEVEVQLEKLESPWIYEESERFDRLDDVFHDLHDSGAKWPMTVSWIDTSAGGDIMGRGIVMRGRWATAAEAPPEPPGWRMAPEVPPIFPSGVMNRLSVRAMNTTWFAKHGAGSREHYVGPEGFYYQLDMATEWNRGYGKRGFTQYQCVMPSDMEVYREFLKRFQTLGGCSFVTVFKECGDEGPGPLSFPKRGTTLALDIPITHTTEQMVHMLNDFVVGHGGRVYLAKDAFTRPDHFRQMYPRVDEFLAVKKKYDPDNRFTSVQAQRLGLVV